MKYTTVWFLALAFLVPWFFVVTSSINKHDVMYGKFCRDFPEYCTK